MATESTVVGELYSPKDEATGERKRILIDTTTENVIDPSTGKTAAELFKENSYSNATESKSGLMSPDYVKSLKALMNEEHVISDTNPNKACVWFQVDDIEDS